MSKFETSQILAIANKLETIYLINILIILHYIHLVYFILQTFMHIFFYNFKAPFFLSISYCKSSFTVTHFNQKEDIPNRRIHYRVLISN